MILRLSNRRWESSVLRHQLNPRKIVGQSKFAAPHVENLSFCYSSIRCSNERHSRFDKSELCALIVRVDIDPASVGQRQHRIDMAERQLPNDRTV